MHRFCDEQSIDHGGFQELLGKLAAEQRLPADTREQQQRIFSNLRHMKSFCEKGPCAKLKRFMAPLDSWKFYKDEMWGLKLIFEEINKSRGNHENDDDGVVEARWHKEQKEELGKLTQHTGIIALVPGCINEQHMRWMRAFNLCAKAFGELHGRRAKHC